MVKEREGESDIENIMDSCLGNKAWVFQVGMVTALTASSSQAWCTLFAFDYLRVMYNKLNEILVLLVFLKLKQYHCITRISLVQAYLLS